MSAVIRRPGEGQVVSLGKARLRYLVDRNDTQRLAVTEVVLEPGYRGPILHRHEWTYDVFYVLSGSVVFRVGDGTAAVAAGGLVLVPPGTPHSYSNPGSHRARMLNVNDPAGVEQYSKEVAQAAEAAGGSLTAEQVADIAARYDFHPA